MQSLTLKQINQVINYNSFMKIVKKYGTDKWTKEFNSWNHLIAMIYFHLSGTKSLRNLISSLQASAQSLYHMGIGNISLNNFSHSNSKRDSRLFEDLYYKLMNDFRNIYKKDKKKFRFNNNVTAIDATVISLCQNLYGWADFRKSKSGIKLHTEYNINSESPGTIIITNAKTHDSKPMKDFNIEKGTIYILDRAYCDTKALYSLVENKAFYVTRLKSNFKYKIINRNKVSSKQKKLGVKTDWEIEFTNEKYFNYPKTLRLVRYKDKETCKMFSFITNIKKLTAKTIADIYKKRWSVELFFKELKQNLKIKHFIGNSENAVKIQIWTALIVFMLFKWQQYFHNIKYGFTEFISRVRTNLTKKISLSKLLTNAYYEERIKKRQAKSKQGLLWQ